MRLESLPVFLKITSLLARMGQVQFGSAPRDRKKYSACEMVYAAMNADASAGTANQKP